jgi:carboxyl-terminal processing protease
MTGARTAFLVAAALVAGACGSTAPAPPAPAPLTAELAVEVFDSAWTRIHESYYDTTFGGLDWHAVKEELRPRAAEARTVRELRATLEDMLARLGESHFAVIPAEHADALDPDAVEGATGEPGTVGLELRVVDGELVVSRVVPDGPGARAGVATGWIVEQIDTLDAARLLAVLDELTEARRLAEARVAWTAESRLAGRVGDAVEAVLRDGRGETRRVAMESEALPGTPVRFGNLPTMFSSLEYDEVQVPGGCAGVIRFDVWMTPILPALEEGFLALRHCAGFVLDLRGNPGGVAGMAMGVAGYFMEERQPLGIMRTRQQELRLVSMPRRVTSDGRAIQPFTGPLALVVDGQSMSTTEIFAAGLQGLGRARLFGEATGGQALPALMSRLPNDDVLMYVFADFVRPDGTRIEGRGAVPDTHVPLTRQALLDGRDEALDAAIRWVADVNATAEG